MKKKFMDHFNNFTKKFKKNENNKPKSDNKTGISFLLEEFENKEKRKIKLDDQSNLNYYYRTDSDSNDIILFVAVVAFHHKKGSIIEYVYPPKETVADQHKEFFENRLKTEPNKALDDIYNQLTIMCLPDAVHLTNEDSQFFFIQNFDEILYGISCYKQLSTHSTEIDEENTRNCVQKAICIVSKQPLFGIFYAKLNSTLNVFFEQYSLKDKKILDQLYTNFVSLNYKNININEIFITFSLRKLFMFMKEKVKIYFFIAQIGFFDSKANFIRKENRDLFTYSK